MSSSTKSTGGTVKPTLSPREERILMAAWVCIKGSEPAVDYDRLARILGLKNSHTASTVFYTVKKKVKAYRDLLANGDGEALSPAGRASTSHKRSAGDRDVLGAGKAKKARRKVPSTPGTVKALQGQHTPQSIAGSDYNGDI